jgi:hypothetical protein
VAEEEAVAEEGDSSEEEVPGLDSPEVEVAHLEGVEDLEEGEESLFLIVLDWRSRKNSMSLILIFVRNIANTITAKKTKSRIQKVLLRRKLLQARERNPLTMKTTSLYQQFDLTRL